MTAFTVTVTILGALGSIAGIAGVISGIAAKKTAKDDRIRAEAAEDGKVSTRLALIQQSISNMEKGQNYTAGRVDAIEKVVSEHTKEIAVIKDKASSAHHRIDEIRNQLNLEVKNQ